MNLGLKDKVALITGGATGLGKQIACALAKEGADICFTYLSDKENPQQVEEIVGAEYKRRAIGVKTNLANPDEIDHLYDTALKEFGHVDLLVNNAGIWLTGYVGDIDVKDWDTVMAINLRSVFYLSQRFVCDHKEKGTPGSIANVTSQAAFHGSTTGHSHYAASKAGLIAFSISLAREVAKEGINVNNVAVGIMNTPMIREKLESNPDYYVNRIPMGRVAEPEEIAEILAFLLSDKARYMTGATVDVTGGMLMR